VNPDEAKQLYLAAQAAQRRVPALDTSARQLVMLTAQAAGLHGRSTTTAAIVRKRALALIHELDGVKHQIHVLIEACLEYETPPETP
jgi:UDP-N-acetylenolpyruvoylglucosamine reductase